MDALSHVLGAVRLTGAAFLAFDTAGSAPSACASLRDAVARMPGVEHVIECHLVTAGSCWAGLLDEPAIRLEAGDVIVCPRGGIHLHGAISARVIAGFLGCDVAPFNPLLATLPRVVHVPATDHLDSVLHQLIEVALVESSSPRSGSGCVLSRLGELFFVEVMRRYLAGLPPANAGWYAGVCDENVGRALQHIHHHPARAWTLDELAKVAGMSRSMLAERFALLVGVPPIQYLAKWRIQLAASLLRAGKSSLAEVADRVGYGSEAALSRAFKRCVGLPPARYRQGARGAEKVARGVDFRPNRETLASRIRNVSSPVGQTA
jgi:AraC-like DNA-binding protein